MYYDLLLKTVKAREKAEELGLKTFAFSDLQPKDRTKSYDPDKIVFVRGGTLEQNKKIVRSPCDVLLDATLVDSSVVQVANDNDVAFGISLHQFLYSRGMKRARLFLYYQRLLKLYDKMDAKVLLVSGANNNFEVRPPKQLISMGVFLGQTKQQAKWSVTQVPEYLISKKVSE